MSNIITITSWRVLLYHRCYQSTSYIVCVDVALTKEDGSDRGIKWKLGQCDSPKTYYPELYRLVGTKALGKKYLYGHRCCMDGNQHTLTCAIKYVSKKHAGWADNYLTIQGRRYCDDFVGFSAMRKVSVTGMLLTSNTYLNDVIHLNLII